MHFLKEIIERRKSIIGFIEARLTPFQSLFYHRSPKFGGITLLCVQCFYGLTHEIDRMYTGTIFDANEIDDPIAQELLGGREAEVWTPIFSLAQEFCPDRFDAILACAATLSSTKQTHEKRRFSEIRATEEGKKTDDTFTRFAMMDLARVFKHGQKSLYTEEALARMKAIPTSPWRAYKSADGLTPVMLSDLVSCFGVNTKSIKTYRTEKGKRVQVVKRGFQKSDVDAGLKKLGEN